MKKALSLALALAMCLGLMIPAFAAAPVTLTDGDLALTIGDVLFEEDAAILFDDFGEASVEIVHVYYLAASERPHVTVTNHGGDIQGYTFGIGARTLSQKDGIWTAADVVEIGDYREEVWQAGTSWDLFSELPSFSADDLYYSIITVGEEASIEFWCVMSDQPFSGNQPERPDAPVQPEQPAKTETAMPTNDKLTVDGEPANPTVYKIGGSNYFKIRDVAALLNGTSKQFSVGYDSEKKSVTATTGEGYTKLDTDLLGAPAGGNQTAAPSNDVIYINGQKAELTVYKINGGNYFKLRDLGDALGFTVDWSKEQGMMIQTK